MITSWRQYHSARQLKQRAQKEQRMMQDINSCAYHTHTTHTPNVRLTDNLRNVIKTHAHKTCSTASPLRFDSEALLLYTINKLHCPNVFFLANLWSLQPLFLGVCVCFNSRHHVVLALFNVSASLGRPFRRKLAISVGCTQFVWITTIFQSCRMRWADALSRYTPFAFTLKVTKLLPPFCSVIASFWTTRWILSSASKGIDWQAFSEILQILQHSTLFLWTCIQRFAASGFIYYIYIVG